MKKMLMFIMLIIVISISSYVIQVREPTGAAIYSFKDGLKEVRDVEKKFNFDQGYPEPLDDKWAMLGQLSNIKNYVENLPKSEDINALYAYIHFRTRELSSKISFQTATKYKLNLIKDGTLLCPQKPYFLARIRHFNESIRLGAEAIDYLKTFINQYPEYVENTDIPISLPRLLEAQYYEMEKLRFNEETSIMNTCFS